MAAVRAVPLEGSPALAADLVDYCSRPMCRREFRRRGPGRRQAYCSDLCRRTAQNELRSARARLAHYEQVVERLRLDVAAFGKDADDVSQGDVNAAPDEELERARVAVGRVAGILAFTKDYPDPMAQELRDLHDAVAPVVSQSQ